MSKLLISYVNDWDAGTLTYTSQHPSFPATHTQQRWFKKPWRSEYPADHTTDQYLYCDLGSTKTIKFISVKNHNLRAATGSITVIYYSDAFSTIAATDVLTWHAGIMAIRVNRSYRYIALKVSDPSNPDTYLEIGRVWVGGEFVAHYGFTMDRTYAPQDPSVISSSDDGQESSVQRSRYGEWNYVFDAMTAADRLVFAALFLAIGKSMPCFIAEVPPAAGDMGLKAQYVKFIEWEEPHVVGTYWALSVSVRSER